MSSRPPSVSLLCQPLWILLHLKPQRCDNRAPSPLNISLILFPSHTPPQCLRAPVSWCQLAAASEDKFLLCHPTHRLHDNANSPRQQFSVVTINARHVPKQSPSWLAPQLHKEKRLTSWNVMRASLALDCISGTESTATGSPKTHLAKQNQHSM